MAYFFSGSVLQFVNSECNACLFLHDYDKIRTLTGNAISKNINNIK